MRIWVKYLFSFVVIWSLSCDNDDPVNNNSFPITFTFTNQVNNEGLELNNLKYENLAGNRFSVEKLQYLISDVILRKKDGGIVSFEGYHFVDVTDPATDTYEAGFTIEEGDYTGISFVFGFRDEDNISGAYPELNILSWSWPEMLGGGYHFMKLEGRFIDSETNISTYATHMGTAREITSSGNVMHSNFVEVDLEHDFTISGSATIRIGMEVSNWYSDPHIWDLNVLDNLIMPNFEAQTMLRENANNVFFVEGVFQQ